MQFLGGNRCITSHRDATLSRHLHESTAVYPEEKEKWKKRERERRSANSRNKGKSASDEEQLAKR